MPALVLVLALGEVVYAAPATVLDHRVEVTIDGGRRLKENITWVVRIDDPAACAAGVLAPPGLDGASDGGAMVLEDLLVVPQDAQAGATYTLTASHSAGRGGHSGAVVSAPDLPVEQATVSVSAPSWIPLTVWADPSARPTFDTTGTRQVVMSWQGIEPGQLAQAAWSTWEDWAEAGEAVAGLVDDKLADKQTLGRDLASGIEGLGIAGITERAYQHVALDEGVQGDWSSAAEAAGVRDARSGSAADRGILLLSLLRVAGHDAKPAYFRPASVPGLFPVTVPAPSLLPRPVIVVERPDGRVYVDPAAERASVPDLPASMLGAMVWVPGELPYRVADEAVDDGIVAVNATLTIAGDGSASWSASIQATGAAQEYLRDLLAPLDEAGRTEALARLARQARPDLERVQVSASGTEKPSKQLKITVSGHDPGALEPVGFGLRGTVAPTLAPALAGWLPPRLAIEETLAITPPPAVTVLGSALTPSAFTDEAVLGRTLQRQGQKAVLHVEVERPYRRTTPTTDAAAAAFLASEAPEGVDLLLFTAASGATLRGLRSASQLSEADKAVLEALLWWSEDNARKATKVLAKAEPTVGFEGLIDGLTHWADPADLRPWQALSEVALEEDNKRILVVEGLERAGALHEAWKLAVPLSASADPDVRTRAFLARERLQGPQPDAAVDPEGAELWEEPLTLLLEAQRAAAEIPGASGPDPRVVYRLARLSLAQGDRAGAETLLEQVERSAVAEALLALAAAMSGLPDDEVRERVEAAVAADPRDAAVFETGADALDEVGDAQGALRYALTAARLAHHDPDLWANVAEHALDAGDLPRAVDAARRASDLDPENRSRAQRWGQLATVLGDKEQVDLAHARSGDAAPSAWPPSIDERMGLAPEGLLALLQSADREVSAEARLLAMRGQMRIEAGLLDEAARDGLVLASQHGQVEGWALAFAATAGRQYSTAMVEALDGAVAGDPTARTTRMEFRLVSGSGDPLQDARAMGDDPRAEALVRSVSDPAAAVAEIEGWPEEVPTPSWRAPRGWRVNKALSGAPGVSGWSNPEAATAIVRVGTVTGLLPPPLGLMYSANPQPVERLEGGGQVVRLDGGVIPLYAAVAFADGQEIHGIAFTVEGAKQALQAALQ